MVNEHITEVIFVGLPGPTHHYSGLSPDNVASSTNRGSVSNPKQAALQVLGLIRLLTSLGLRVAVLPPQLRPHLPLLRQHFSGENDDIIRQASLASPALLDKASSAAAMWTANAATVAPVCDTQDHRLHITTANLFTNLHRRIEAEDTHRVLKHIFTKIPDCVVHSPLSPAVGMYDEGAANHMRLSPSHSAQGLHIFVYGANGSSRDPEFPDRSMAARQTLSASRAVSQQHQLGSSQALFLRQNPEVILQGVFHNDVIALSNENVLLVHEDAYDGGREDIEHIEEAYERLHPGRPPAIIGIETDELRVEEAVQCYFFNSQLVTKPDGSMALIAPQEVEQLYDGRGWTLMQQICEDAGNPVNEVHSIDLRQSMRNGGGPACLRLRVPVTDSQLAALSASVGVMANDDMLEELERVICDHYPEMLTSQALVNPALYQCSLRVLEALSEIMRIPLLP